MAPDADAPALLRRDRDEVIQAQETKSANCISATGAFHHRCTGAADDRRPGERFVDDLPRAELLLEAGSP
jgi:hypothetical protein